MASVIYDWKGTDYLNNYDNLKQLLVNPKIYMRFNTFELNDIQEIGQFLTFNDVSKEKTVREATNCYPPDPDSPRIAISSLKRDEFQGIVPSFKLTPTTISILNDYSQKAGSPNSVMIFITNRESYNISEEDLEKKVSNFSEGTINADCPHVETDLTETLITPNFNGVIIYINNKESSSSLLKYIREEIDNKQEIRNDNKLKKNIIIETILASNIQFVDKIKLIAPYHTSLVNRLILKLKLNLQDKIKLILELQLNLEDKIGILTNLKNLKNTNINIKKIISKIVEELKENLKIEKEERDRKREKREESGQRERESKVTTSGESRKRGRGGKKRNKTKKIKLFGKLYKKKSKKILKKQKPKNLYKKTRKYYKKTKK